MLLTTGTAGQAGQERQAPCEIPGYPEPPENLPSLGLSWCPASVDIQLRSIALTGAVYWCAINTGRATDVDRYKQLIGESCDLLDGFVEGGIAPSGVCQCSAAYRETGPRPDTIPASH